LNKAAIYARINTRDKSQDNENQLRELCAFAERSGYSVYKEYTDQESGGKADRAQFQQLFADAHQRRFDVVLFWALDRFSREGVIETLNYLQRLSLASVQFKSYTEQYLDSTGMFKEPSSASWPPLLSRSECVWGADQSWSGQGGG